MIGDNTSVVLKIRDKLPNGRLIGGVFRSECPFCQGKKSRPFIFFDDGRFFCHSCNEKGNAKKLVTQGLQIEMEGIDSYVPTYANTKSENKNDFKWKWQKLFTQNQKNKDRIFELFNQMISADAQANISMRKISKFISYDSDADTLAIALYDDERVANIKRRRVGDVKWMGQKGGDGRFCPHRLTGKKFVFVASGIAEFLILHASEYDYIVTQSDGQDVNHLLPKDAIAVVIEDLDLKEIAKYKGNISHVCRWDNTLFLPFKQKVTDKIREPKLSIDFSVMLRDDTLPSGFDLRDFVNMLPRTWDRFIDDEIQVQEIKRQKEHVATLEASGKEIVIEYDTKYPNFVPIDRGVVVAKTGSGKTHQYEGKADTLILVPRVLQTTVYTGDSIDYLMNTIVTRGAIITYDKFYGHYRMSDEFRSAIDNKKIKVIVDEAHMLISHPSMMSKCIYELDAVFMSGTLEKFFRADLPRYKYKPKHPDVMYYTQGELPNIKESLVFVDMAKALMHNYPNSCVVGKEHDHNSVNIHTTTTTPIFSTMALREGVSIKNPIFKACMVEMKHCRTWSFKDVIQGLHRVRGKGTLRIVSKPPPEPYTKYIEVGWWMKMVQQYSDDNAQMNALFGEHYSKLIKTTHKTSKYVEPSTYGVVCYLADKTKNNYDSDLYEFREYKIDGDTLQINLDTDGMDEEAEEMLHYKFEFGDRYEFPKKKKAEFSKWAVQVESGLVDKIMKLDEFTSLHYLYTKSRVGKTIKKRYNEQNKSQGKKYSIDLFLKLLRSLVKLEIRDENKVKIERIQKNTSYKSIEIKALEFCPFEWAKVV